LAINRWPEGNAKIPKQEPIVAEKMISLNDILLGDKPLIIWFSMDFASNGD